MNILPAVTILAFLAAWIALSSCSSAYRCEWEEHYLNGHYSWSCKEESK
jgi:hypothetical protein